MSSERVHKVLAQAGFGSRRSCEEVVAAGRVRINGDLAEIGARVDTERDTVTVDGVPVSFDMSLVHYALHKPTGVVTTAHDPQNRPTVVEIVPPTPRVFPVGRLDTDTSGLLLLTNDGEFANTIAHPRYEVPKTYVAEVKGKALRAHIVRLREGVDLSDGLVRVRHARVLATAPGRSVIELIVQAGRNRMVRRVLEEIGLPVTALVRTQIGPLELGRLRPGAWRKLSPSEVQALKRTAGVTTRT